MQGDLAIYRSGDIIEHTGVVLEIRKVGEETVPLVLSKWGPGPEYIHAVARTPYGHEYEYWTERP